MLGWSINLFRVFGIQLSMHVSFLLLLAYVGFEGWGEGGWIGSVVNMLLVVAFFVCVVLHELGHSLTARRYGVQVPRILLMPIGGMAEFDRIPRQPRAELLITAAGPAVNFAIVVVLAVTLGVPEGFPLHVQFEDSFTGIGHLLLYWNAIMGTFNLLPVFPMDGGRIFRALLARKLDYLRATYWAALIGKILAGALALAAAFYLRNPFVTVLFIFIFFAGDAEYRLLLRREQEAAHWADWAKRVAEAQAAGPRNPDDPAPPPPPLIFHGPN